MSNDAHSSRGPRTIRRTVVTTAAVLGLAGTAAVAISLDSSGEATSDTAAGPSTAAAPTPPTPALPGPTVDMAIVRESEDDGKTVNLTLDDGPDPRWTPKALELLKRYKAQTVFAFTPPSRQIAAAHGMRNLGWNVDPGDFRRPGADAIVRAVLPWFTEQGYAFSFPRAT
ncbi:polysaccharide deacetylase family protein [Streptomyces sp. NPDC047315]|uniref:polysaccharide deacetylase family protein n=1 Tax=Streptomyces sp. NPDC047315 TaxID=3155142 RepID=UPI0033E81179